MVVAVAIRCICPARQPSPKKWPASSSATTASFPACDKTDSLTAPLSTYITLVAGSPWAKICVAAACSTRCTSTPVQSTGSMGLTARALFDLLIRRCRRLRRGLHTNGRRLSRTDCHERPSLANGESVIAVIVWTSGLNGHDADGRHLIRSMLPLELE